MNKNDESNNDSDEDFEDFFLKPKASKNNTISKKQSKNSKNGNTRISILELNKQAKNDNKNGDKKNFLIKKVNNNKDINKNESNNIKTKQNNNLNIEYSYIKIDKSNIFTSISKDDYNYIESIISSFKETKRKKNTLNSIFTPFLDKISPGCDGDPILISKALSKEIFKINRIKKVMVENFSNTRPPHIHAKKN